MCGGGGGFYNLELAYYETFTDYLLVGILCVSPHGDWCKCTA